MIIFGRRNSPYKRIQQPHIECPDCKTKGSTVITVFSKYVHVFWIPMFPYGKIIGSQCHHCGRSMDSEHLTIETPEHVRADFAAILKSTKYPFKHFIAVIVIPCVIIYGTATYIHLEKLEKEYINSPLTNDVYTYKTEQHHYSTYLVFDVNADSVYLIPNNYECNQLEGIKDINTKANYGEFYFSWSRNKILDMHENGTIIDVKRDQ